MSGETKSIIAHVSDTAILTAIHRIIETRREDALFRDPYAELLTGERGKKMIQALEARKDSGAWGTITRTVALDEMIMRAVRRGVDTVVNLAAGLDARPYRLDLPSSLRWIEVDFPGIIAYKTEKFASENPKCSLERVSLDLTDLVSRRALFDRINREGKDILVVTEGLLVYLKKEDVILLASDLHKEQNFRSWITDVINTNLLARATKNTLNPGLTWDVRVHFGLDDNVEFFGQYGWDIAAIRSMSKESRRIKREPPRPLLFKLLKRSTPKNVRKKLGEPDSHFLLLERR
jgi:methyltransferase (TIGR00027 family)